MTDTKIFHKKDLLAYAAVLALCIGFLISRSMYSFGLLFMGLYWITDVKASAYLWKHPVFVSTILICLLVPVSDFANNAALSPVFYLKLSLPLFIVFFFTWRPSGLKLRIINHILIGCLAIASVTALIQYYINFDGINENYITAKVMRIGYYHDHIRISIAIALSIILAHFELEHARNKIHRFLLIGVMCFHAIFLHVLSARTGLIVFYTSALVLLISYISRPINLSTVLVFLSLVLLPIISFKVFPSFYNRIGYSIYDLSFYKNMVYRQGSSDGFRYFSIKAGIAIGQQNPVIGVGFNNLPEQTGTWLQSNFPSILESEIIQPSSEFALYFGASGFIGLALFLCFALSPFVFMKSTKNIYFISIYIGLFVTFLFEILLENQYGLYVYGYFFALAWWIAHSKFDQKHQLN